MWRSPLRPLRPTRLPRPSPHVGGHSCDHLVKSFWNGLLRESEVTPPSARRQARRCAVLRSAGGYSRSTPGGDRSTMPSPGNWRSPVRLRQSTGIWNFSARTEVTRAPESAHKSLRAASPQMRRSSGCAGSRSRRNGAIFSGIRRSFQVKQRHAFRLSSLLRRAGGLPVNESMIFNVAAYLHGRGGRPGR